MKNLIKAVNAVMNSVKGIDKSLTVGEGRHSYQGVADQDVKKAIGEAMEKNGLAIFPTGIERVFEQTSFTDKYGNPKNRVFVEVVTKYSLVHESGEQIDLTGYGHGVDSQDKAAGKATTYALKYALLYTFLVPTGKIDDTDNTHSAEIENKPPNRPLSSSNKSKPILSPEAWEKALERLKTGDADKELIRKSCNLTPEQEKELNEL